MRGIRMSGLCVVLAGIVAVLHTNDGLWQYMPWASCDTAPQDENDIMFMLQAKGAVELAKESEETVRHRSADLAKVGIALHNPGPDFALNAEPGAKVVEEERWPSSLPLSLVSAGMWRTKAESVVRTMAVNKNGWISLIFFFGVGLVYWGLAVCLASWADSYMDENGLDLAKREAVDNYYASLGSACKVPENNPRSIHNFSSLLSEDCVSLPDGEQTSAPREMRFSFPLKSMRQGRDGAQDQNEVVILSTSGEARLHFTISKAAGGTRLDVSKPQGDQRMTAMSSKAQRGQHVTIEYPPGSSPADANSLEIHGEGAALFGEYLDLHGCSTLFKGTLDSQDAKSYTVWKDKRPVMYLRVGADANKLMVTTGHGKLVASIWSSGVAFKVQDQLEIRVDESNDAILVLACAFAVIMRLLV